MKLGRYFAMLVIIGGVGLCARQKYLTSNGGHSAYKPHALNIYSRDAPGTERSHAQRVLAGDARRRAERFAEATHPGLQFSRTRVSQAAIEGGRISPDELFQLGAQLFHYRFQRQDGFGSKEVPTIRRVQAGERGGPDAYGCADCHRRGGPAGAGDASDNAYLDGDGDSVPSSLERNPIALSGAGLIELLAREMSAELSAQRETLIRDAKRSGQNIRRAISAKGVGFGHLTARQDGTLDTREVDGVDADLIIKPFGWKGHAKTIRGVVEDELLLHHGMQSTHLVKSAGANRLGHFDPPDPDGDGVIDEISEGQVTALTLYIAMQEVPQQDPPKNAKFLAHINKGEALFEELGCSHCHVTSLPLNSTIYELRSRSGGPPIRVNLATDGAAPRLGKPTQDGSYRVHLFSDLKRHAMGPNLREARRYRSIKSSQFLTRPLWGIARSRPYLHDARAPHLESAILSHSGKAQAARNAYAALKDDEERGYLRLYLTTLTRAMRLVSP